MSCDSPITLSPGYCDDTAIEIEDEFIIEFDLVMNTLDGVWEGKFIHLFDIGDSNFFVRYGNGGVYLRYSTLDGTLQDAIHTNIDPVVGVSNSHRIHFTQTNAVWEINGVTVIEQEIASHATGTLGYICFPATGNAAANESGGKGEISNFKIENIETVSSSTSALPYLYPNTILNVPNEWVMIFVSVLCNIILIGWICYGKYKNKNGKGYGVVKYLSDSDADAYA